MRVYAGNNTKQKVKAREKLDGKNERGGSIEHLRLGVAATKLFAMACIYHLCMTRRYSRLVCVRA